MQLTRDPVSGFATDLYGSKLGLLSLGAVTASLASQWTLAGMRHSCYDPSGAQHGQSLTETYIKHVNDASGLDYEESFSHGGRTANGYYLTLITSVRQAVSNANNQRRKPNNDNNFTNVQYLKTLPRRSCFTPSCGTLVGNASSAS